ncbi:MAG TPA: bifunctional riboflavin kinase/FAD synthetase, partial [Firmicutes bacterium]|nr:bifunctional riboflavin kinase/FAD synthetase [Bacillota bacterium]
MHVFRSIPELAALDGPVAVTVGFFDGLHLGHQSLLAELKELAGSLQGSALILTFSNSPKAFHNGGDWHYLTLPDEKLYLLGKCGAENVLMLEYDESVAGQTAAEFFSGIRKHCQLAG